MILITGGTGQMGGLVARRLIEEGQSVRVMTRSPSGASLVRDLGADVVRGDLLDRESLQRACEGVEGIVTATHSIFGRGRYHTSRVDGRGQRDLIDAAVSAGVRRFVYTSAYDFGAAYRSIPFVRIKLDLEENLKSSGLDYAILRPTAFMDPHAHTLIGKPVMQSRPVQLIGSGETARNFVAPEDVARIAAEAVSSARFSGETVAIAGPQNLTDHKVVEVYEKVSGRKARVRHTPLLVLRIVSTIARPLHPGIAQVLRMAIVTQREGQSVEGEGFHGRFGFEPFDLEAWAVKRIGSESRE